MATVAIIKDSERTFTGNPGGMLGVGKIEVRVFTQTVFVTRNRFTVSINWFQQLAGERFFPAFRWRKDPFHLLITTNLHYALMTRGENN